MTKIVTKVVSSVGREVSEGVSDEQLMLQYAKHADRAAFNELVKRYEQELYSYLSRYLGDGTLAEDAFQASFLQVHLKCDQFDGERKFRPWLYTIATNQAIDAQRRNKRHRGVSLNQTYTGGKDDDDVTTLTELLVGRESDPAESYQSTQEGNWVRDAVAALPDVLRGSLSLVYYQGLKYREAADVLGVPVGTVKSRVHSALLKLNEEWATSQSSQTN